MKNSKFRNVQGRTFLNDGIPVAPLLMILSFLVTSVIVRIKEKRYA